MQRNMDSSISDLEMWFTLNENICAKPMGQKVH